MIHSDFSKTLQIDLEYIYSKTKHLVNELNGKTILVTGGTGFIGKWILEYFLFLNHSKYINFKVIVLSRNPRVFLERFKKFNVPFIQFIQGDIVEFNFKTLPYCNIIIHAAADADAKLNYEQPLKMIDTIVDGTRKVLDYAAGAQTKKILFLSSGAIYGIQANDMTGFSEDHFGGPDVLLTSSAYAEAKRLAELFCICYLKQFEMNVSIARCFAFVGPYLPLDMHYAIGNFIGNALNREDIIIKGDGMPLRSYMYAADLLIWLLFILFTGENGQAYNVGSDNAVSIKELAQEVTKFFPDLSVRVLGQINPTDRNQNYIPCTKKIKTELNVPDILTLNEAIHRTIQYHLEYD
jgi:nucleoside-diphosphate-sugar epimerase